MSESSVEQYSKELHRRFQELKDLADRALAQVQDDELERVLDPGAWPSTIVPAIGSR